MVKIVAIVVIVALLLVLGQCGRFTDFDYGPGDWLSSAIPGLKDSKGVEIAGEDDYERLITPDIRVHITPDLTAICGGKKVNGCALGNASICDIYLGPRAASSTLKHEQRHCYGWKHAPERVAGRWAWYPNPLYATK